jgi:exonuclease SbcC
VCGSTEHPAPASPSGDGVTEADQVEAHAASEAARRAHEASRAQLESLRAEVGAAQLRAAGLSVEEAERALQDADSAVHAARTAAVERQSLTERLDHVVRRAEQASGAHEVAALDVADLRARLAAATASRDAAVTELRTALAPTGPADDLAALLQDRIDETARLTRLTRALLEAEASAVAAGCTAAEALAEVEAAAHEAGFDDAEAARAALLDPPVRVAWERALRERETARVRLSGVLAEPDVAALDPTDGAVDREDDLRRAEEEAATARQAHARTVAQHEHAQHQLTALRAQADQLASAVAAWAPVEAEAATVGDLANLVRGSGDNRLRMRLSSYVLATRLDQVLDAANARLTHMRDTRYLLRRTDRARRANAQAGLDLEVLDEWTGEVRPPSSLSGGECFVVSLALALGLADVIGEESGGVEVDTLFIDEGFGTLDPETLDQVMDRIDDLRSGGRAVGVVSHVNELRNRITTQVHVHPGRSGSRIAIAHGDV